MVREILSEIARQPNVDPTFARAVDPLSAKISEAFNARGYSDISTVYAYYTAEEKAQHGKHCEWWTCFSNHYPVGQERAFIAKVEAENPGKFASYLISWSGCD